MINHHLVTFKFLILRQMQFFIQAGYFSVEIFVQFVILLVQMIASRSYFKEVLLSLVTISFSCLLLHRVKVLLGVPDLGYQFFDLIAIGCGAA